MFFVDKPYISNFLKNTLKKSGIPVVGTDIAHKLDLYKGTKIISKDEAVEMVQKQGTSIIYTTSENSIGWIAKHLQFTDLPGKIDLFKNKFKFRQLIEPMFPEFYFKEVYVKELKQIQFDSLPLPFIIKPRVGFMSMGVYKVANADDWAITINSIIKEIDKNKDLYPAQVVDTSSFIIEQCIEGEEFAVDAYFNSAGEPVVLNILKHIFSSDADVSDRIFLKSLQTLQEKSANLQE